MQVTAAGKVICKDSDTVQYRDPLPAVSPGETYLRIQSMP